MRSKLPFYLSLISSLTLFSADIKAIVVTVSSADIENAAGLRAAINSVNAATAGSSNTINVTFPEAAFTFTQYNLPPIVLTTGSTLTINGGSKILDGTAGSFRGFIVERGNVTINNMAFQNLTAQGGGGGDGGGGGGGGLGAGGAIYIGGTNTGSAATVTLQDVTFNSDRAIGGNGGAGNSTISPGGGGGMGVASGSPLIAITGGAGFTASNVGTGGGGGGVFGIGGRGDNQGGGAGGGGLFGNGGRGGGAGFDFEAGGGGGGMGISQNGANGVSANGGVGGGPSGGAGGLSGTSSSSGSPGSPTLGGGGGGAGGAGSSPGVGGAGGLNGGGGGGGANSSTSGGAGGNGGFNGGGGSGGATNGGAGQGGYGGGGAGSGQNTNGLVGGNGGYGGGGGGGRHGGTGGFGAGGGGSSTPSASGGGSTALGGSGGSTGSNGSGGGGGGAALGGMVFIESGGTLIFSDGVTISGRVASPLTAGAGGTGAGTGGAGIAGSVAGQDIFLPGGGSFHYNSPAATNLTITNLDDAGISAVPGTGLFLDATNTGTLTLTGTVSAPIRYQGNISLAGGTLQITADSTLLTSPIVTASPGILAFAVPSDTTYAGLVSGTGGLTQNSPNVLQLSGASTYSGPTSIAAGTLQVGINDALPDGTTVTISSGATLDLNDFSQTVTGVTGGAVTLGSGTLIINDTTGTTVSSAISGTGGVNKTGVGTTIISGINTYTGGTEIDAGILQSSGTNTLASASVHDIASGATLDLNGTSQVVGGITGLGGVTLGGGVLTLNNSGIDTYNGGISGAGSLIKANTGTQILAAASTYTGATTVSEGTLQVEASNAIPTTSETTIASGATLNLNGVNQTVAALQGDGSVILGSISTLTVDAASVPSTYSGVISGLGSLTKSGPEDLTLLGANTYGGGTTVNAGTLIGDATSLQGAITNNTLVEFDQSTDGTFSGTITGAGTLEKEGTGTLNMTGVTSIGGAFNINQGQVNFLSTTTVSTGINVASGASMGGTGLIIGPITVSGTVAPGQSIGTLSVDAITFSPGSIFEVEFDTNTSDLLQVTGTADISGATLNLIPLGGGFDSTESYTIITAGSVVGTFAGITGTPSLPRYAFQVNYFPMSVQLFLALTELPFSSIVTGGNAGAAAAGFQTLNPAIPDVASVISFLNTGTTAQLQCDFDQLQSAMFNAIPIIQEATSVAVRSTLSDRLAQIHGNECWQNTANNRGLWITPLANFSKQKGRSQGSSCDQTKIGFHSDAYGVALGVDGAIGDIFVLGGALSYAHTNLHWDQSQAKSHINSGFGSVYGTVFSDLLYLDLGLTGAYNRFEGRRNIYLNNITSQMQRSAKHHNHASEFDGYLGLGATVNLDNIQIRPFGALEYIYIHETAYNENGANSLDLVVQKKNSNLLREQVGLAVSFCQNREMISWSEEIQLSYIHENRYQGRHTKERFMDSTDYFTVSGFLPNRNLVAPAISLSAIFLEDFSLTGSYEGEFGNNWRTQTGTLEFLWKF